jgi:hypothetical protein
MMCPVVVCYQPIIFLASGELLVNDFIFEVRMILTELLGVGVKRKRFILNLNVAQEAKMLT